MFLSPIFLPPCHQLQSHLRGTAGPLTRHSGAYGMLLVVDWFGCSRSVATRSL